ncbi:hypothetical protein JTB14_015966 [Gonioctena quinquepunctata]|nr:hypothetical protein JTB14_015966 [Gonioctena quinquepunctata]
MDNPGASGVYAVRLKKSNQKLKSSHAENAMRNRFAECPAFGKPCYKCGKDNHFSSACPARKTEYKNEKLVKKVKEIIEKNKDSDDSVENYLFLHSERSWRGQE